MLPVNHTKSYCTCANFDDATHNENMFRSIHSGGPFGIEPSVKAAGNLYAIIGIALMPFVWAVPEMYMTYRLSTMFPCASGGVLWVEKAMNPTMGLVQGYLGENLSTHFQHFNAFCIVD